MSKTPRELAIEIWHEDLSTPEAWADAHIRIIRAVIAAELLRVRTTQHGAAHAIDNMGIELGLGANASPTAVAQRVRELQASEPELKRLREALRFGIRACLNDLRSDKIPLEWSVGSGIHRMLLALGCDSRSYDDAAKAALSEPPHA